MKIKIDYRILFLMIFFIVLQRIEIYIILLSFCIIHELGHVFAGIILGKKIEKLEFLAIGCRVKFLEEDNDKKEIREILIAAAGPLTNLIFVLILMLIPLDIIYKDLYIYANFLIGIFNLLPIYPLDGGRILKNVLKINENNLSVEEIINNVSNITMIILTMISSILIFYYKNIFIFITVIYLWSILIKENRRYFLTK